MLLKLILRSGKASVGFIMRTLDEVGCEPAVHYISVKIYASVHLETRFSLYKGVVS